MSIPDMVLLAVWTVGPLALVGMLAASTRERPPGRVSDPVAQDFDRHVEEALRMICEPKR